jgi:predicted methyltransferase
MIRFLTLIALLMPLSVIADQYDDVVNNPNRPEADHGRDALRQPATVLRIIGVGEGLTVLDVGAGGGYYSEMFSYLVGGEGEVIIQNPSQLYEIFPSLKESVTKQRLGEGRLPNARLIDAETVDLGLADGSVDLVFFHLIYHDMFWLYPDQIDAIHTEISRVLKPGGRVVIIDHDSVDGAGITQALSRSEGTHRVEDAYVEQIMTDAGFKLVESSDVLRNGEDDHSQPFFAEGMRGKPTDRFFHIYQQ